MMNDALHQIFNRKRMTPTCGIDLNMTLSEASLRMHLGSHLDHFQQRRQTT